MLPQKTHPNYFADLVHTKSLPRPKWIQAVQNHSKRPISGVRHQLRTVLEGKSDIQSPVYWRQTSICLSLSYGLIGQMSPGERKGIRHPFSAL